MPKWPGSQRLAVPRPWSGSTGQIRSEVTVYQQTLQRLGVSGTFWNLELAVPMERICTGPNE